MQFLNFDIDTLVKLLCFYATSMKTLGLEFNTDKGLKHTLGFIQQLSESNDGKIEGPDLLVCNNE